MEVYYVADFDEFMKFLYTVYRLATRVEFRAYGCGVVVVCLFVVFGFVRCGCAGPCR